MKSGMPWSVKGIEPEAREAAKDAARRLGLTLGEWLNSAILEQAETGEPAKPRGLHPRIQERIPSITEELAMMTGERQQIGAGRGLGRNSPAPADYDAVLERVENNERYLSEALSSVNERLRAMHAQVASQAAGRSSVEDAAGYKSLEAALRNIVEHIANSERRSEDALKSVQEQISTLGRRDSEALGRSSARLQEIEALLGEFSRRLEARDEDDGRNRLKDLEQAVEHIEARGEARSKALVEKVHGALADSLQKDLSEIQKQVQSLASHAQSSSKQSSAMAADVARTQTDIARLKADLGSLTQRVEDITNEAASERDLQFLQRTVEQLSARVAQLPVGDFEQRLNEVARRMSEIEIRGRALPQAEEIGERLREIETVLAESRPGEGSQDAIDALQDQIERIDRRLAGNEERFSAIAGIERSISQLFQALEDNRQDAHDIAEEAARRVAEEFLRQPPPRAGESAEVAALEDALAAVKQQSARSDQQTQETLDALHDTLEEIVNKLAELEAGQRAILEERRGAATSAGSSPSDSMAPRPVPTPAGEAETVGWHRVVQERLAKSQEVFAGAETAPQAEPDLEMELFAPAEAGEEHQPEPISTGEDDEFILAARRAAQAAAQGTSAQNLRMAQGADRGRVKKSSRFSAPNLSFSLFRRTPSLKPRQLRGMSQDLAAAADSAALPPESGRRRLLLAAFLLLLAVSAYALRSGLKDTPPPPSPPHSETQPERPPGPAEKRGSLQLQNGPAAPQFAAAIAPDSVRAAAAAGDAKAQYLVAERLFDGKLNTKNPSEAAKWYEKAASQGFAPAQYRLGSLYERGTGVGQDLQEARRWYESAARQGNIKAMHNLGVLLAGGDDPDYAGSARWFSAAADHGLKDSQYNIAVLYERGLGVEKNAAEAYFWYSAAARQNDADALEKAKTIGESLAPSLKNGALMRLEQWTPAESAGEANSVTAAAPVSRG